MTIFYIIKIKCVFKIRMLGFMVKVTRPRDHEEAIFSRKHSDYWCIFTFNLW